MGENNDTARYTYFSPSSEYLSLLTIGQQIVIDHTVGMATLVDWNKKQFLCACTLFDDEAAIFCPLLQAWPEPVPYAQLVAALNPKMGESLSQQVAEAIEAGDDLELLALLENLQNCLDNLLERLKPFGLTILSADDRQGLVVNAAVEEVCHARA